MGNTESVEPYDDAAEGDKAPLELVSADAKQTAAAAHEERRRLRHSVDLRRFNDMPSEEKIAPVQRLHPDIVHAMVLNKDDESAAQAAMMRATANEVCQKAESPSNCNMFDSSLRFANETMHAIVVTDQAGGGIGTADTLFVEFLKEEMLRLKYTRGMREFRKRYVAGAYAKKGKKLMKVGINSVGFITCMGFGEDDGILTFCKEANCAQLTLPEIREQIVQSNDTRPAFCNVLKCALLITAPWSLLMTDCLYGNTNVNITAVAIKKLGDGGDDHLFVQQVVRGATGKYPKPVMDPARAPVPAPAAAAAIAAAPAPAAAAAAGPAAPALAPILVRIGMPYRTFRVTSWEHYVCLLVLFGILDGVTDLCPQSFRRLVGPPAWMCQGAGCLSLEEQSAWIFPRQPVDITQSGVLQVHGTTNIEHTQFMSERALLIDG